MHNIDFILKVSERCNIACKYCYFFFRNDQSFEDNPSVINPETVESLPSFFRAAAESTNVEHLSIGFHGGEPLLLKKHRFDEICQAIHDELDGLVDYSFSMQTNGMLIDQEWVDLFEKWDIALGISIDGTKSVHDENRIDHKGRGTYERVIEGIDLLHAEAEARECDLYPGVLSVINPKTSGKETYRHFVDDLDLFRMDFLFLDVDHDSSSPEAVEGTTQFLLEVLEEWISDNNPQIHIRFFSEILSSFIDDEAMHLIGKHRHNLSNIFTINSDGTLGPEDVIKSIGGRFKEVDLNVQTDSLKDYMHSPVWQEIETAAKNPPSGCSGCKWLNICGGGALVHRYSKSNGFNNPSVYCSGLKKIYSRVEEYVLSNGVSKEALARRLS